MDTKTLPADLAGQRERLIAFIEARRPIAFIELIDVTDEDDEIVDTFEISKDKKLATLPCDLVDKILQAALDDASVAVEPMVFEVRLWNHNATMFGRDPVHFARRQFVIEPPEKVD